MKRLAGQMVVITGAGSGIGRALAHRLDELGAQLALCDINESALTETAARVSSSAITAVVDVADRAAVGAFAGRVLREVGRADVVINNAGVDVSQSVADTSLKDFEWLFGINFWGVVHGTRAFLPSMLERDRGVIANVSSIFGYVAWPMHSAYVASKFAVRGFTESLRHELQGTGVHAIPVHPGGVRTNIVKGSRFYVDDAGQTDRDRMASEFELIARTSADDAAAAILRGIARRDRRILVGRDARMLERITRLWPDRYWSVMAPMLTRLRSLLSAQQSRASDDSETPQRVDLDGTR